MANGIYYLTERGFGRGSRGEATIICGEHGKPLPMRLLTLPNGSIGGEIVIVPNRNDNSKSFITDNDEVYELKLIKNDSLGTVRIRHFIAADNTINVNVYETAFIVDNKGLKLVHSGGMNQSHKADDLIDGILNRAFIAALKRASSDKPSELFYGIIAHDGGHKKKEWFDKSTISKEKSITVKV